MKNLLAVAALVTFQLAAAQKTVPIKDFKELAVSGDIELTLVSAKENKLVIDTGNPDDLKISTDEGNLALQTKQGSFKVTVYFGGKLEDVAISGGVSLKGKETFKGSRMNFSIAGGSEVNLSIDTQNLSTAIASGSEVTLTGTAKNVDASVASGAEFNGGGLKTEHSNAVVASGAEATVFASDVVDATVASGGELTIQGNPKTVNQVKADGAEIHIAK